MPHIETVKNNDGKIEAFKAVVEIGTGINRKRKTKYSPIIITIPKNSKKQ